MAAVAGNEGKAWDIAFLPIAADCRVEDTAVQACLSESREPRTVFFFSPDTPEEDTAARVLELTYGLVRALLRDAAFVETQFYCCYRSGDAALDLIRDGLSGLFKSAMLESANHRYRSIAFDDQLFSTGRVVSEVIREWLCDETLTLKPERVPMVRLRDGARLELRIDDTNDYAESDRRAEFREGATYLMVGGLGDVGELVCKELGRKYGARLVILSRRGESEVEPRLASIEASGASVIYRSVDILDRQALHEQMQSLQAQGIGINGVIHMARRVQDAPIVSKDFSGFSQTMAAKVQGTLNVDAATAGEPLDFFLVYSSMAAFGIKGSADYAYSTAFQNEFVRYRNRLVRQGERSGRSLAVCWGQWEVDGAIDAGKLPQRLERIRQMGVELIDAASALDVMNVSLRNRPDVVGFMAVGDRHKVRALLGLDRATSEQASIYATIEAFESGALSKQDFVRFLDSLPEYACTESCQKRIIEAIRRAERADASSPASNVPAITPAGRPQSEQRKKLNGHSHDRINGVSKHAAQESAATQVINVSAQIINNVAKVLGLNRDAIEVDRSFQEYGLDSISAAQLSAALEKQFKFSVPPSLLVECSTVNALTDRMKRAIAG